MAFPSPPWQLYSDLWGSLFRAQPPGGPHGLYAVALVAYRPGGTLSYSELVVARRADDRGAPASGWGLALTVRDLLVDSAESREGGRALWGLPKELGTFTRSPGGLGPVHRTAWRVEEKRGPVLAAEFLDASALAPRVPLRGSTRQPTGTSRVRVATIRGSARTSPCLASWSFEPEGRLGWLAGRSPMVSFRLRDFSVAFA